MDRGYVHVFTGDGKGKTTAAIGLVLRAAGSGHKILFAQFNKRGEYSEIKALNRLSDLITIEQFGHGRFINGNPHKDDILAAQKGLKIIKTLIDENTYNMIVLDEINVAVKFGLITENDLLSLIVNKPRRLEMIITGRYASPRIIQAADNVTEMKAHKHYYSDGVMARVGIDK